MVYNVSFEQIVDRLVVVLNNSELKAQYMADALQYEGVCGWCGVMSPLTRQAMIKELGLQNILLAEIAAEKIIADKLAAYNATAYHAHELEADAHFEAGCMAPTEAGQFVWAVSSCMKGEGGFSHEIECLVKYCSEKELSRRLCVIEKVIKVDSLPMSREDCDRLISDYELKGGCRSDDVSNEEIEAVGGYWKLTKEQFATFYTIAAAVVDAEGRWYLADAEGYDYVRYYYSPLNYSELFAPEIAAVCQAEENRKAEEARKEAADRVARRAAYDARCQKWEKLMEAVKPYEEKRDALYKAWEKSGNRRSKTSPEYKALRSAETKLNNARRRNILAMAETAFPGVKFSLRKNNGWGSDWELSWTDGPTADEFDAATDFDLLANCGDRFDGMEDLAYTDHFEFCDFCSRYMQSSGYAREIDAKRHDSQEAKAELLEKACEVVPELKEAKDYAPVYLTCSQVMTLAKGVGVNSDKLHSAFQYDSKKEAYAIYTDRLAYVLWLNTSYYVAPEAPTTPDPDNSPKGGHKAVSEAENGSEEIPTGLHLIEIEGGVAVVGDDWKDTYFHKREIKAHGAKWNKEAKQWQATDPEAVASLREWLEAPLELPKADHRNTVGLYSKTSQPVSDDLYSPYGISLVPDNQEIPLCTRQAASDMYDLFHKVVGNKHVIHCYKIGSYYDSYGIDAINLAKVMGTQPCYEFDWEGHTLVTSFHIHEDQIGQAQTIAYNEYGLQIDVLDGITPQLYAVSVGSPSL